MRAARLGRPTQDRLLQARARPWRRPASEALARGRHGGRRVPQARPTAPPREARRPARGRPGTAAPPHPRRRSRKLRPPPRATWSLRIRGWHRLCRPAPPPHASRCSRRARRRAELTCSRSARRQQRPALRSAPRRPLATGAACLPQTWRRAPLCSRQALARTSSLRTAWQPPVRSACCREGPPGRAVCAWPRRSRRAGGQGPGFLSSRRARAAQAKPPSLFRGQDDARAMARLGKNDKERAWSPQWASVALCMEACFHRWTCVLRRLSVQCNSASFNCDNAALLLHTAAHRTDPLRGSQPAASTTWARGCAVCRSARTMLG